MPWAAAVLCLSCVLSGIFMVQARHAAVAGALLLAAGGGGWLALWLWTAADAGAMAAAVVVASALILAPAACWAYPQPRWRTSADAVLGVCLVGPGLVALTDVADAERVATMAFLAGTGLLVQTWWRLEHAVGRERQALSWFGLAAGAAGFASLALLFLGAGTGPRVAGLLTSVGIVLLAAVPAAMALGAARAEMVDVRGLVGYALMLAVACTAFIAYYVGVHSIVSQVAGRPPAPGMQAVVALVGVAALRPGSAVLRRVMDRLLFGDRPDALRAATRALDRSGADPGSALDAVRESLVLPYARLVIEGDVVGASGAEVPALHSIPLSLSDGTQGELVIGLRPGDLRLAPRDEDVLRLVGPLLAQSVRARVLAADLRDSRGRVISTIEEERRRLRRDLHDGLGPTLTGIALSADAARNSMRTDPDTAEALLVSLRSDAAEAVDAIRRLVYGMRPPALDELGLARALRQQASSLRTPDGRLLTVDVEVAQDIPPLAAAVEVAAYRIVMEALSNVARHATGAAARVRLRADTDRLAIEVTDSGAPGEAWRPGVGVASMRERAAEVGGELWCGATANGGRVAAVLPLL